MAFKDMVVFLDASADSEARLAIAIAIAREHGAVLVGAYVCVEAILSRHHDEFARGGGIGPVVARETAAEDANAARVAQRFADMTRAEGIEAEWNAIDKYGTAADVILKARYADLSIVGQSGLHGSNGLWRPEDLLFAFGGPTLIVPQGAWPLSVGKNILIAWDASREAKRAVADAMPFLMTATRLTVLVVDPKGKAVHGHEPGTALTRRLGRRELQATLVEVPSSGRNIGRVINEQAQAVKADLIVMGAYGHSKLIEMVFGGATRTVLREMPVPVLMSH